MWIHKSSHVSEPDGVQLVLVLVTVVLTLPVLPICTVLAKL